MKKLLVNRIIPFSNVDGEGNRAAIFLQGCNYNCLYCHNPETINACDHCGICVDVCPAGALSLVDQEVNWDQTACKQCDDCLKACPSLSSPKTRWMTVDDLTAEIEKVRPFIRGVTVSGGECTLQPEGLVSLFSQLKEMELSCFLDTNGSIDFEKLPELLEVTDRVMVDLKSADPEEHLELTGQDNEQVIANIRYLGKLKKLSEVRTVVVPGLLLNRQNIDVISHLIAGIDASICYKLIKFRPHGVRSDLLSSQSPSNEEMENLRLLAEKNGLKKVIVV